MPILKYPAKPAPGDRVAILSPSAPLATVFPHVYRTGIERLERHFGLVPVEYPTTLATRATPAERAADIHAAFDDPDIKAVLAVIGGEDQITVLPHLDADRLAAHPKPFFGYSDNTNLLNFLRTAGVIGYYGGSVMVHLARNGGLHPQTEASLRAALFTHDWFDLSPATSWRDEPGDWSSPEALATELPHRMGVDWTWHGPERVVEAPTWGGSLEVFGWTLQVGKHVPMSYDGGVLLIETSEETPSDVEVYRTIRHMGERGLLADVPAVLVAKPQTLEFGHARTDAERDEYREHQRTAILRALSEYAPDAVVVFGLDFGHTSPQQVMPYGGLVRIDSAARTVSVLY
jgi:muramoyltetrapeptide carboxypeptidase LdcA involved in peptidoglycan recycling